MKRHQQKVDWPRLLLWAHALSIAGFYLALWQRTKPDETSISHPSATCAEPVQRISIIVPARNEERNIQRCVTSLLEQDYANFEVIVVNDGSTDCTTQILDEVLHTHPQTARLRVLHLHELPSGWAGKPHALHCGTQEAHGDFLLFTDADTWHAPDALRAAILETEAKKLDLFSLVGTQELPGFWAKVMMPMAYLGINLQYPIQQVNDPHNPLALANGQYILIRRAVYEQLGGYARVDLRDTLLDDRDLARLVKKQGFKLELADGRDLQSVCMYRNLPEIWRGWSKNVFLGSRGGLSFVLLQLLGLPMVTILPFLLPLWLWLTRLSAKRRTMRLAEVAAISALELTPLLIYRRQIDRELRVPWYYNLTHPLAGLLFMGILGQSTWRVLTGKGVNWSGRDYYKK